MFKVDLRDRACADQLVCGVDDDIHASEGLDRLGEQPLDVEIVRDIRSYRHRVAMASEDLLDS